MGPEAITAAAALATAVAAAGGGFLARGSTAVPAAAWAAAAAAALAVEAACQAAGQLVDPAAVVSARLGVAALGVCPAMSLLGAKRPQHGVWQLIVATLACVLAMPAVSATLVRPGSMPDLHPLERFFLPILVLVGWMNFVATRRGLAATLVAAGQMLLMWPLLTAADSPAAWLDAAGGSLLAAGAATSLVQSAVASARAGATSGGRSGSRSGASAGGRADSGTSLPPAGPATSQQREPRRLDRSARWPEVGNDGGHGQLAALVDPPFVALRETLGSAWSLRIAERFNAVAAGRGWPCRLGFTGLVVTAGEGPVDWQRQAVACCRSILRRFVSPHWLARHGGLRIRP